MNHLHDLMAKLQAIEEAAKKSDIPAAQRKASGDADWKVTQKDLDKEEHEGKISHPKTLAKNSGRADEAMEDPVSDVAPDQSEIDSSPEHAGTGAAEESMEECGGDQPGGKVELSMQDLLALMSHLQKGQVGGHDMPLMGDEEEAVGEEYANSEEGDDGEHTMPVSAMTQTGNDMFSKGKEAPKVNGGGNPMEAALAELYASVKDRQLDELSKGTLGSYIKKAVRDKTNGAAQMVLNNHKRNDAEKGDGIPRKGREAERDEAAKREKEATALYHKRGNGINKAVDRLSLKEANAMARKLRK